MKIKYTISKNGKLQFSYVCRLNLSTYKISGTVPAYVIKKGIPAIQEYAKKIIKKKKLDRQINMLMERRAGKLCQLQNAARRIPKGT